MRYLYYPGCSLESTALEYDLSARAVCNQLGIELIELEDWNCCGATSAHSTNQVLALALPARNLLLAGEAGCNLVVPCAACYNRLKITANCLNSEGDLREQVLAAVGISYINPVQVYSLLEVMAKKTGLDAIEEKVSRPLTGLKVACFYGCLLLRPLDVTGFDDSESPILMDRLVETLGANAVPWFYKTDCCGAGLAISRGKIVTDMVTNLLEKAGQAGADALVTACPLCQSNLEMRRSKDQKIPVFYFPELMGAAFNLPQCNFWFKKHLVDPRPLLESIGISS